MMVCDSDPVGSSDDDAAVAADRRTFIDLSNEADSDDRDIIVISDDDDDDDDEDEDEDAAAAQRLHQQQLREERARKKRRHVPEIFAQTLMQFIHSFDRSRAAYLAKPVAERIPEAAFLAHFHDALSLLIGKNSAWLHNGNVKAGWDKIARGANTIDLFELMLGTVMHSLTRGYMTREYHQMNAMYEGIDKTVRLYDL